MKAPTLPRRKTPTRYAQLAGRFMPRPLHGESDYRQALAVLDTLAGFPLNADQEDYFESIATFVEKYEAEHHALHLARLSPVALLRLLMEEHAMNESDLGRLLGDRSLGHRLLQGERELSKSHIRILAEHFSLDPGAFF